MTLSKTRLNKKHKQIIASTLIGTTLITQTGLNIKQHNTILDITDTNNKLDSNNKDLSKELNNAKTAIKEQNILLVDLESKVNKQAQELLKLEQDKHELNSIIKELKSNNTNSVSRGSVSRTNTTGTPIQMTLTFYGEGAEENGGYAGIDCNGNALIAGTVASNVHKQGTQFKYNNQIFTVRDKGGSNFNSYNRLDVFVPRNKGESKQAYDKRISNYGKKTITMYQL